MDIGYVNEIEGSLYHANRVIDELTKPYVVNINGVESTVRTLKAMRDILDQYKEPINISMKLKTKGKR